MDCAEHNTTVQRYYDIQAQMLTELLTDYGPIPRMWWDMYSSTFAAPWNAGGFPALFTNLSAHAKALAPQTLLLPGPDGCLVGGETGSGSYPCFAFNEGPTGYACQRMDAPPLASPTLQFSPHEQDHSILNPGDMWWWVQGHAWLSAAQLYETYLQTIGRGNTYILNMPPNSTGLIPAYLTNETAQLGAAVAASFSPASALARAVNLTLACGEGAPALPLPLPPSGITFDAVVLEEDLGRGGQRIAGYELQACSAAGGACGSESQWRAITGADSPQQPQHQLGVSIGRRVIERGLGNGSSSSIFATGLRLRCTAAFPPGTAVAYLQSFSAHAMQPPPGWPTPPFSCAAFNCTCRGMADWFGVGADGRGGWGCAPPAAQQWWVSDAQPCQQPGYSCCAATDYTKKHAPFPGCSGALSAAAVAEK
jgi:hypothetical protein